MALLLWPEYWARSRGDTNAENPFIALNLGSRVGQKLNRSISPVQPNCISCAVGVLILKM
jgi:hypothetical protein